MAVASWRPTRCRVRSQTLQPIGLDARLGPTHASAQRTPLVVLVVGETARAANFSLGGYPRPTNPQLASCRPRAA
jgi:lipid A ethanolaminephosphotransferase